MIKILMFVYRLAVSPLVFAFFMLAHIIIGLCSVALYVIGAQSATDSIHVSYDED